MSKLFLEPGDIVKVINILPKAKHIKINEEYAVEKVNTKQFAIRIHNKLKYFNLSQYPIIFEKIEKNPLSKLTEASLIAVQNDLIALGNFFSEKGLEKKEAENMRRLCLVKDEINLRYQDLFQISQDSMI
ncbi:hypothetical protein [Aquimarina pacifica]|uniref:hypothetical protein n=1 Tax=Aquimarina pacifica TaxID=1296415 RepID=UPI0004713FC6|nr:hypothetical protein [Aquimarina pacifica]